MTDKVTIVFADGSKEMAHNLDDLRERWLLRRQKARPILDKWPDDIIDISYHYPATFDEAVIYLDAVKLEVGLCQARLSATKGLNPHRGGPLNYHKYKILHSALLAEKEYKIAVLRHLKHTIKTMKAEAIIQSRDQAEQRKLLRQKELNEEKVRRKPRRSELELLDVWRKNVEDSGGGLAVTFELWSLCQSLYRNQRVRFESDEFKILDLVQNWLCVNGYRDGEVRGDSGVKQTRTFVMRNALEEIETLIQLKSRVRSSKHLASTLVVVRDICDRALSSSDKEG